jgi:hypothetical protein
MAKKTTMISEWEREREREEKRENHHCIVDHYSKNEQLEEKKN